MALIALPGPCPGSCPVRTTSFAPGPCVLLPAAAAVSRPHLVRRFGACPDGFSAQLLPLLPAASAAPSPACCQSSPTVGAVSPPVSPGITWLRLGSSLSGLAVPGGAPSLPPGAPAGAPQYRPRDHLGRVAWAGPSWPLPPPHLPPLPWRPSGWAPTASPGACRPLPYDHGRARCRVSSPGPPGMTRLALPPRTGLTPGVELRPPHAPAAACALPSRRLWLSPLRPPPPSWVHTALASGDSPFCVRSWRRPWPNSCIALRAWSILLVGMVLALHCERGASCSCTDLD